MTQSMAHIKQVKAEHEQALLKLANVLGVGIGLKETGGQLTNQLALIVNVTHKMPVTELAPADVVPPEIDGVITDVQATGPIKAL